MCINSIASHCTYFELYPFCRESSNTFSSIVTTIRYAYRYITSYPICSLPTHTCSGRDRNHINRLSTYKIYPHIVQLCYCWWEKKKNKWFILFSLALWFCCCFWTNETNCTNRRCCNRNNSGYYWRGVMCQWPTKLKRFDKAISSLKSAGLHYIC